MLKIFYSLEELKDLVSLLFHYCVSLLCFSWICDKDKFLRIRTSRYFFFLFFQIY